MLHLRPQPAFNRFTQLLGAMLVWCLWMPSSGAQTISNPSALDNGTQQWLEQALSDSTKDANGMPLRPEVVIGQLDSRLQLAPCARVEPYLPKGTQLWGKTRIGLRCLEGPVAWNVFLPITVKAWGPAWVVKRTVQAQAVLTEADVEWQAEVDWAEHRSAVLPLAEQWVGMQATTTLLPGQAIRQQSVRAPMLFPAGSDVKVVASGSGFELTASGQAISPGFAGQAARVKLSNGKIVTGTVQKNGTLMISI